jgi:hypothetical protein
MIHRRMVVVLALALTACSSYPPLGEKVPLQCALPSPPGELVPEEITCEVVSNFAVPAAWSESNRSAPGVVRLSAVAFNPRTDSPVEAGFAQLLDLAPATDRDRLSRIGPKEFRREYWHSPDTRRYQTMFHTIPMPESYAELTVWHPDGRDAGQCLGSATYTLYRPIAEGKMVPLLDARTAFAKSGLPGNRRPIEPIKAVYLRYLPTQHSATVGAVLPRVTVRPVWCFFGDSHLIGDIFSGETFYVDAVTGQEFVSTLAPASP